MARVFEIPTRHQSKICQGSVGACYTNFCAWGLHSTCLCAVTCLLPHKQACIHTLNRHTNVHHTAHIHIPPIYTYTHSIHLATMCRDIHPRTSVHICNWDRRYQERKDEREHKELRRAQERLTAYYQVREMGAGLNWATALLANANGASVTCLALPHCCTYSGIT